jgi:hypothetical protein
VDSEGWSCTSKQDSWAVAGMWGKMHADGTSMTSHEDTGIPARRPCARPQPENGSHKATKITKKSAAETVSHLRGFVASCENQVFVP